MEQKELDRLMEIGRLTSALTHEFNNVLMGILPFVEVVRRGSTDPRVESATANMMKSIDRGRQLTREVKELEHLGPPAKRPVSLEALVREAASHLALGGVAATVESDGDAQVDADPEQLRQLLQKLAAGASPGSPVTVRVRGGEAAAIEITLHGVELAADVVQNPFDPMAALKRRAPWGLSMVIAQRIAANHDGGLTVESLPEGVVFRLTLAPATP